MSDGVKFHRNASFLLATVGRRAEHEWNQYLRNEGTTTAQFTAMAVLVESEMSQRGLANLMGIDPRNAGAIVRQLQDRGWIQTRSQPTDARVRLLAATEAGRKWWQRIQDDLARGRDRFFAPLTERELATLQKLLNRLNDHLTAE
jgi:DNA-binding MarR family transcriptional regulator